MHAFHSPVAANTCSEFRVASLCATRQAPHKAPRPKDASRAPRDAPAAFKPGATYAKCLASCFPSRVLTPPTPYSLAPLAKKNQKSQGGGRHAQRLHAFLGVRRLASCTRVIYDCVWLEGEYCILHIKLDGSDICFLPFLLRQSHCAMY